MPIFGDWDRIYLCNGCKTVYAHLFAVCPECGSTDLLATIGKPHIKKISWLVSKVEWEIKNESQVFFGRPPQQLNLVNWIVFVVLVAVIAGSVISLIANQ